MSLNPSFDISMTGWDLVRFAHKYPEATKELVEKAATETRRLLMEARGFKHTVKTVLNWEQYNRKLEAAKFLNEVAFNGVELWPAEAPKAPAVAPQIPTPGTTALEMAHDKAPALKQQRVELTEAAKAQIGLAERYEKTILNWTHENFDNKPVVDRLAHALSSAQSAQVRTLSDVNRQQTLKEMNNSLKKAAEMLGKPLEVGVGKGVSVGEQAKQALADKFPTRRVSKQVGYGV